MSAAVSPIEQMVVVLARDLADGELGAAGAAALVPMAAIALARELHAPNLTVGGEMFFNPEPGRLYPSMLDDRALGRCEAAETITGWIFSFTVVCSTMCTATSTCTTSAAHCTHQRCAGRERRTCHTATPRRGITFAPPCTRRETLWKRSISLQYPDICPGLPRNATPGWSMKGRAWW